MSAGFDWQTEETVKEPVGWDEPSPEPARPSTLRRHWGLLVAIAVLAIIVGFVVWRQIDRRVDEATLAVQADVVGSVNLVHRAVQNGDKELFRSLLSGRSASWTRANLDLFERDLLFDRRQLGMVAGPLGLPVVLALESDEGNEQTTDESAIKVTLSPDLTEAEVVALQPYLVSSANQSGEMETVWLRQTAVYRRGEQGWLLAPPLRAFWGSWQTVEGERLDVTYPERDGVVATRLAADLDALLVRACSQLDNLDCPADWHVTLRLESDPDILVELNDRWLRPASDGILELPAPTLVGLPVDHDESTAEAGYQALLQAYASRLVRSTVGELTGYDCCRQMLFYRALVDRLLSDLGVQTWPVTAAGYQRLLDERVRLRELQTDWYIADATEDDDEEHPPWRVYALVDYLLRSFPDVSAVEMIELLGRTDTLNDWMRNFLLRQARQSNDTQVSLELGPTFDRDWWLAAYQMTNDAGDTAPEPSSYPLYLNCFPVRGSQVGPWSLHRFRPDDGSWESLYEAEAFMVMLPLPGAEQLLLQEYGPGEGEWQLKRWVDGRLEPLVQNPEQVSSPTLGGTDPSGQYLTVYSFNNGADGNFRFPMKLFDLGRCANGHCPLNSLAGPLRWSPDGTYAIYEADDDQRFPTIITVNNARWSLNVGPETIARRPLYLGPGKAVTNPDELQFLGEGYAPFWIDERTYGFLRHVAPGEQEVVLGIVGEQTRRPLVRAADLRQLLADGDHIDESPALQILSVAPHPLDPDLLFLVAPELRTTGATYFFSLDRETGQLTYRLKTELTLRSLGFSPDGRYMVISEYDGQSQNVGTFVGSVTLFLHDIAQNKTIPFLISGADLIPSYPYDWTPDGKWLAFPSGQDLLALVAMDDGYIQMVEHDYGFCNAIGWLSK